MEKNQRHKQIYTMTFIAFLVGLMIMGSFFTHRAAESKQESNTQELVQYIEDLEAENQQLEASIKDVRAQMEELESSQYEEESQLITLNALLTRLNTDAHLTALTGPGLVVTLNDNTAGAELAQKNSPSTYVAENYLIHDKDILYLVRSLAAATEACSVNGIRLTDASSIRCAGTIVLVNANRLAPPYEISLIGDPTELLELLEMSGTYRSLVYRGLPVKYEQKELLLVPAYTGAYSVSHGAVEGAEPPPQEEAPEEDAPTEE